MDVWRAFCNVLLLVCMHGPLGSIFAMILQEGIADVVACLRVPQVVSRGLLGQDFGTLAIKKVGLRFARGSPIYQIHVPHGHRTPDFRQSTPHA
jgi:hypothetical protein